MKKYLKLISIIFVLFCVQNLFAQQEAKPKVALVLSGGGALGIAHIPTLQVLDSLGIVPDIVIGTSMGSIVGALYSMGYSGDSIAEISKNTNWEELFGSKVSIKAVSNEEKSEFNKYLVEIKIANGKTRSKSSIINDQNLRLFFNELTVPVYDLNNFDELPIPFRAVATDIVNGKEIVLDKGSLSFAMRSSMSIPAVFDPMPYKDVLLVDGGVLNNFPTDVAKAWGADIIIGSDVGGGMEPKEKLNNPVSVVFQTGMLASNLKNSANRALCDVLIDHTIHLTHSTGDFSKNKEIFNEGRLATYGKLSDLVLLADKLKMFPQKKPKLRKVPELFQFDTISYNGISEKNMDMFKARVNLEPNKNYTKPELKKAIENAFGTNLFMATSFYPFREGDKIGLSISAKEKSAHLFKGSLHFDDYRGIGLDLNYTGRNIVGKSSRIILNFDIAEGFRYRTQYQKNFGKRKNWWFRSEFYGQNLEQQTYISGNFADDIKYKYHQFDNQFNKNIDAFKSYVGIGLNYEWSTLSPKRNPAVNDNVFNLESYDFTTLDVYAHYVYNSLDQGFYATRGSYFQTRISRSLFNEMDAKSLDEDLRPSASGSVNGFSKLTFDFEKRLLINDKMTAIFGLTAGYTFLDEQGSEDHSYTQYGYAAKYFLGGNIVRPRKDDFVLPGLKEDELPVTQFSMIDVAVQINPYRKIYLTPHLNVASVGFGNFGDYVDDVFSPDGDWDNLIETSLLTTAGIRASYNSILGPVEFDFTWVNNVSKVRVFFGVGLFLNRSN